MTKSIISNNGKRYVIGPALFGGAQGQIYKGFDDDGFAFAIKIFHEEQSHPLAQDRCERLVKIGRQFNSPLINFPFEVLGGAELGIVSPWIANAITLEEFLGMNGQGRGMPPLKKRIIIALQLVSALEILSDAGFEHGDLHLGNLLVSNADSETPSAVLIDLDNLQIPGMRPLCFGSPLAIAPELRRMRDDGLRAELTAESDRYSLAAALHNVLLEAHPASGEMESLEELWITMRDAPGWRFDLADANRFTSNEGDLPVVMPVGLLSPGLQSAFRRGLRNEPGNRTTAAQWKEYLSRAIENAFSCENCGGEFIFNAGHASCPLCRQPFVRGALRWRSEIIPLNSSRGTIIGRRQLRSPHVSASHVSVRRRGPEYTLLPMSSNPTMLLTATGWTKISNLTIIKIGDQLKLGDQIVQFVAA